MTLDNEQQRQLLLQLIEAATIPGSAIDAVHSLKTAVLDAKTE